MENKALVPENINLSTENVEECIKTMTHWGYNTYNNICNGAVSQVDWGSMDYVAYLGLAVFIFLIVALAAVGLFKVIFDY